MVAGTSRDTMVFTEDSTPESGLACLPLGRAVRQELKKKRRWPPGRRTPAESPLVAPAASPKAVLATGGPDLSRCTLVLQRRDLITDGGARQRAAFDMGPLGSLIAALGVLQPAQQVGGAEPHPRQQFPHRPRDLWPGDLGHLFPPIPAACAAGTPRPRDTS